MKSVIHLDEWLISWFYNPLVFNWSERGNARVSFRQCDMRSVVW